MLQSLKHFGPAERLRGGDSARRTRRVQNQPASERWYDAPMKPEEAVLKKLRKICLALPDTEETVSFGHPTFRVRQKTFAVMEEYKGELGICVNVGKLLHGIFLEDFRFFRTPYIGKHGWVTLRVFAAPLNWKEVAELVKGSYLLVSPQPARKKTSRHARRGKKQR
jgi:predicted DNA-binding protein (MmcQ/YjbR family)